MIRIWPIINDNDVPRESGREGAGTLALSAASGGECSNCSLVSVGPKCWRAHSRPQHRRQTGLSQTVWPFLLAPSLSAASQSIQHMAN